MMRKTKTNPIKDIAQDMEVMFELSCECEIRGDESGAMKYKYSYSGMKSVLVKLGYEVECEYYDNIAHVTIIEPKKEV